MKEEKMSVIHLPDEIYFAKMRFLVWMNEELDLLKITGDKERRELILQGTKLPLVN